MIYIQNLSDTKIWAKVQNAIPQKFKKLMLKNLFEVDFPENFENGKIDFPVLNKAKTKIIGWEKNLEEKAKADYEKNEISRKNYVKKATEIGRICYQNGEFLGALNILKVAKISFEVLGEFNWVFQKNGKALNISQFIKTNEKWIAQSSFLSSLTKEEYSLIFEFLNFLAVDCGLGFFPQKVENPEWVEKDKKISRTEIAKKFKKNKLNKK